MHKSDPNLQTVLAMLGAIIGVAALLGIERAIVQAHRGQATAVSPGPDQGSTFSLTLPPLRMIEYIAETTDCTDFS